MRQYWVTITSQSRVLFSAFVAGTCELQAAVTALCFARDAGAPLEGIPETELRISIRPQTDKGR